MKIKKLIEFLMGIKKSNNLIYNSGQEALNLIYNGYQKSDYVINSKKKGSK